MKATGIVRRIDDLGRVVIPREIRRALGIKDGDALELYTDEKGVYFEKYNGREEAMTHAFEPMRLALYKMGYSVSLYGNDCHMAGQSFRETPSHELVHGNFGVWGGIEFAIVYRQDDIAIGGAKIAHMIDMMAASLKEVAREIYGEE